jgi:hypothetical protein
LWIGLFRNAADVSEYAIRADPSAGSEATEDGVEHPLPRSEHGGSLAEEKAASCYTFLAACQLGRERSDHLERR